MNKKLYKDVVDGVRINLHRQIPDMVIEVTNNRYKAGIKLRGFESLIVRQITHPMIIAVYNQTLMFKKL